MFDLYANMNKQLLAVSINQEIADDAGCSFDIKMSITNGMVSLSTPRNKYKWKFGDNIPNSVCELLYFYLEDMDDETSNLRKVLKYLNKDYDNFIDECQEIL